MTDKEILVKVLEKTKFDQYILDCLIQDDLIFNYSVKDLKIYNNAPVDELYEEFSVRDIIFSHDFAKAFWGEEKFDLDRFMWEIYLQRMVLEEEPLKYLENFL